MQLCLFYRFARSLVGIACAIASAPSLVSASEDGADEPTTRAEVYGQGVRETPKQSPEQERRGFHLPTGFTIELVTAEPNIAKPMNIAFDMRGRLWVTSTVEYPYPAQGGAGRDSIIILEDENGDGRADKHKTFAEGLNIPIGILPVHDGAICFSIPYIWYLRDRDGDDICDERVKLLGPFDTTRDTHGMINALRRGWDGWIYACHGFNNQSNVTAKDGSNIRLTSGNTLRFRDDGSRVEQFTQGQVNPFGMTRDPWGNWFTADCHSKPITFLLHHGCYPSFGRPHDGMGFVPDMMSHSHGSTAICGIVYYTDSQFPEKFRDRIYSGNVMTSRINVNRVQWQGATPRAIEMPDFLTSDDPWFRPVDMQIGPDGALYVADFYNKIIGHYEVPLTHPERDRDSGRIWRISWQGDQPQQISSTNVLREQPELSSDQTLFDEQFLARLDSDSAAVRDLTLDRLLSQRLTDAHIVFLRKCLADPQRTLRQRQGSLWALHRAQAIDESSLMAALNSTHPLLQTLALRSIADRCLPLQADHTQVIERVRELLLSAHPQVQLASLSAIAVVGNWTDVRQLLSVRDRNRQDPILQHAARLASREILMVGDNIEKVLPAWRRLPALPSTTVADQNTIAQSDPLAVEVTRILLGIPTSTASEKVLTYLSGEGSAHTELVEPAIEHACRHLPAAELGSLLELIRLSSAEKIVRQSELSERVGVTLKARGLPLPDLFRTHIQSLIQLHAAEMNSLNSRQMTMIDWRQTRGRSWQTELRQCNDSRSVPLVSSLTLGEEYVGSWTTEPFTPGDRLTFWVAGHNGRPDNPDAKLNQVRLVDAVNHTVLRSAWPPRSDVAQMIDWDLSEFRGRRVILECLDGHRGKAYAWIAVGRFSDVRLDANRLTELVDSLSRLIRISADADAVERMQPLVQRDHLSHSLKLRLLAAACESSGRLTLAQLITAAEKNRPQAVVIDQLKLPIDVIALKNLALPIVQALTADQQRQLVRTVLGEAEGRQLIVDLVQQGAVSLSALRGSKDLLPVRPGDSVIDKLSELSRQADQVLDEQPGLLLQRLEKLNLASASAETGRNVFEKNCANCHQIAGRGQTVGPQLDGIGARGAARLAEDILLPNRNVDVAFRVSAILLDDDKVVTGLVREQPDGNLSVVGNDGKSIPIAAASIVERRNTARSLMPENMSELLNDQDLAALLVFLTQFAGPKTDANAGRN